MSLHIKISQKGRNEQFGFGWTKAWTKNTKGKFKAVENRMKVTRDNKGNIITIKNPSGK